MTGTAIAAHCPTLLMLDTPETRANHEREHKRDPDSARRELDAEFLTGGAGQFMSSDILRPAVRHDLSARTGAAEHWESFIGGDLALSHDSTAFVSVHYSATLHQHFVADVLELRPRPGAPLKLSEVVKQGCAFASRHGESTILLDHHALEPAKEHVPRGFKLVGCNPSQKSDRWVRARELFREGRVVIPGDHARLASMLGDAVSRPTAGGGVDITLPRRGGGHHDAADALILALWSSSRATRREVIAPSNNTLVEYHSQLAGGDFGGSINGHGGHEVGPYAVATLRTVMEIHRQTRGY